MSQTMTQQTAARPRTASILAIVGGSLMVAAGVILLIVGTYVFPNLNATMFHSTPPLPACCIPHFVGSILQGIGLFGLISGVIVLFSGAMLGTNQSRRTLWGTLILVFSVLSIFGTGGFVVGAVLGIAGGAMALTWKAPAVQAQSPS